MPHAHVIYLPGMQGQMPGDRWFTRGLGEAGLTDVSIYDWPRHSWPITNLRDRDQHQRAADALVEMIADQADAPIILIGHSSGCMVIIDALTRLSAPRVAQAWMLCSAVSHVYDLHPALAGVGRLVNVYCPGDYVVLNLGTRLFGSADGLTKACAGYQPFNGPGSDDPRVEQIRWAPAWLRTGHYGGHLGPMAAASGAFAREVISPMIRQRLQA